MQWGIKPWGTPLKFTNQVSLRSQGNYNYQDFVITRKENTMKKSLMVCLLMIILTLNACTPAVTITPGPLPTTLPGVVSATQASQTADWKTYANDTFGFGFRYPSDWFGPGEYVSDGTLRVEVGSDVVYPYGERLEGVSGVANSYNVVILFTKNNQNPFWKGTYQSLQKMKDGESLAGARNLLIRVRQLDIGRFNGFEYISTLSETAQTDHFYGREVMLFDE
jgi:hypothetical protein